MEPGRFDLLRQSPFHVTSYFMEGDCGQYKFLFTRPEAIEYPQEICGSVLDPIGNKVEMVQIADNSLNDCGVSVLVIRGLDNLKYLSIGSNCAKFVESVNISVLPALRHLMIGHHSFTCGDASQASFYSCNKLKDIVIGGGSFPFFDDVAVNNLPKLTKLVIGSLEQDYSEGPFCNAPRFYLGSRRECVVSRTELNALKTVIFGCGAFHSSTLLTLKGERMGVV